MKVTIAALSAAVLAAGVSAAAIEKRAHLGLTFKAPSSSPLAQSSNYVGANNASYPKHDL